MQYKDDTQLTVEAILEPPNHTLYRCTLWLMTCVSIGWGCETIHDVIILSSYIYVQVYFYKSECRLVAWPWIRKKTMTFWKRSIRPPDLALKHTMESPPELLEWIHFSRYCKSTTRLMKQDVRYRGCVWLPQTHEDVYKFHLTKKNVLRILAYYYICGLKWLKRDVTQRNS